MQVFQHISRELNSPVNTSLLHFKRKYTAFVFSFCVFFLCLPERNVRAKINHYINKFNLQPVLWSHFFKFDLISSVVQLRQPNPGRRGVLIPNTRSENLNESFSSTCILTKKSGFSCPGC